MTDSPDVWEMLRAARERATAATRHMIQHLPVVEDPVADRIGEARLARALQRDESVRELRRPVSWPMMAMAASVLIALGLGIFLASRRSAPLGGRQYTTADAQRLNVTLVDGTRVTLAPESHIRLAANYGSGARVIEVEGEAYFAVVHDTAHPFTVRVRGVVTQDVGTAFDVRAYADDPTVRVAVAEGAVRVDEGGRVGDPLLRGGDVADIADGRLTIMHGMDIASLTSWMQGRLVFNETPLVEIARTLSRTFGLSITVADSTLARQHFTGTYAAESLEDVLDDITNAMGARYDRVGHTITIRRRVGKAGQSGQGPRQPLATAQATQE